MTATTDVVSLVLNFTDSDGTANVSLTIPITDPTQIQSRAQLASKTPDEYVKAQMSAIAGTGVLTNVRGESGSVVKDYYFKRTIKVPLE